MPASASQPVKVPIRCRAAANACPSASVLPLAVVGRQTEWLEHNVLDHLAVRRSAVYLVQCDAEHGRGEVGVADAALARVLRSLVRLSRSSRTASSIGAYGSSPRATAARRPADRPHCRRARQPRGVPRARCSTVDLDTVPERDGCACRRYVATGVSSDSPPVTTAWASASAVNVFVIEPISNVVSASRAGHRPLADCRYRRSAAARPPGPGCPPPPRRGAGPGRPLCAGVARPLATVGTRSTSTPAP